MIIKILQQSCCDNYFTKQSPENYMKFLNYLVIDKNILKIL